MRFATAVRFGPPLPVLPDHATAGPGPAAPQPPSRLEQVTGPASMSQDEDCLFLNVWAPEGASGLPVLVFLHGGGYSSGSGGLPWYNGELLAQRGEMVVVTVNYRLGALGFAYLVELADDLGAGNFGLLDQLAALRWVRDHIAGFGGDPDRVTAAGQSAGAYSIVALLSGVSGRGLFRQAILQSLPGGLLPQQPTEATRISVLLLESLDLTDAASLREVPVPDILAAQQEVARRATLGVPPPFQLVADGELVAADPLRTVGERGADGVRIMLTFTRHEARAFAPDADPLTDRFFAGPGRRFAELLAQQGNPPLSYEFGWSPPDSPFGACHCIELPFVFGTINAWRNAPILAGATPGELTRLVDDVQTRWISFVHERDTGPPDRRGGLRPIRVHANPDLGHHAGPERKSVVNGQSQTGTTTEPVAVDARTPRPPCQPGTVCWRGSWRRCVPRSTPEAGRSTWSCASSPPVG